MNSRRFMSDMGLSSCAMRVTIQQTGALAVVADALIEHCPWREAGGRGERTSRLLNVTLAVTPTFILANSGRPASPRVADVRAAVGMLLDEPVRIEISMRLTSLRENCTGDQDVIEP
jgi:hypothetical protein